ncbi:hypothetical protein [Calidifontibacillus oryziterrae]|uniref:hypothetical protein n=1 Tax=Calidifontibacillus oryziterrae TaxID=1191699 RepID=UPI0002DED9AD|nr:hypothetical protein [Calidifontibacillus oryziterrae]
MISILLLLVGFVLPLILIAFGARHVLNAEQEEREDMIKQVYQYAVAFITLIMVIGGGVFAFMSLADYVSPNTYIETFEEYKEMRTNYPTKFENEEKQPVQLSEEDLRKQYDAKVHQQIENSKQRALNSFIKSIGWIIIPFPVYIFFQRRINRDRKAKQ